MSVYRKGKYWRADVYSKGKRVAWKDGFLSKRLAMKWHNIASGQLTLGQNDLSASKAYSFEDLLENFESKHLPTVRRGTSDRYKIDINYRIRPFFQYYKLSKITVSVVEEFRARIMKDISRKSVNNCLSLLKILFKKAVSWKMLELNPAADVDLLKIENSKYSWWSNEKDIKIFLKTAKVERYYLAYRLALDLGMRLGEIIGLSKADINLERRQIHIHRQWLEKEKRYGSPKHNKERYISYGEESDLGSLLQQGIFSSPHKEALIVSRTGNRLGCRKLSGYHFKKVIVKAGVPVIRFHDLRHTFASWFMIRNDDIWALKGILGHRDVQTTQRYAHLSSRFKKVPSFDWES